MIAPMKKIHLAFLEADKVQNLRLLREFGMVHLETVLPSTEGYEARLRTRGILLSAMNLATPAKKGFPPARLGTDRAVALAEQVLALDARSKDLRNESAGLQKELERIAPWGEFDPQSVQTLRQAGLHIAFYEADPPSLERMPDDVDYIILSSTKKSVRLAVIGRGGPAPRLPDSFRHFALPKDSAPALRSRLEALEREAAEIASRLAEAGLESASFARAVKVLDQEIAMEVAAASFASEGPVAYIKGYVPASAYAGVSELCARHGWAMAADDPEPDDSPPTKVENSKLVRLIQPVMDFLGIVPGYREYEISNWFLLFFVLFTAMIFGDAGYGVIMLAASGFFALKSKREGKGVSDFLKLSIILSLATFFWGVATATWFAIDANHLPAFLFNRSIWLISSANPQASQNIQVFCFGIGLVQLLIAHIKNIFRDRGSLKFLAQVGSVFMLIGLFFFVLNMVVSPERFPAPGFALWFVLGGFALNFVFSAYEGSVARSALEGLKNFIPNFLGAVGVFADIVSYIRLWAVGLAGTSLAAIINQMGGGMFKGLVMALAGIALILAGHSLNLVLNILSVIVHGVRLNTLEFSSHLGMEWSGRKYDPFRVTYREEAYGKGDEEWT
ncbi:MAG TPA: hypothetical protein VIO60_11290 [Rectinemataceae bacterium]